MAGVLVVLDFDYTIINENSDTYVVEQLSADNQDVIHERMREASDRKQWTACMDDEMRRLHENGVSIAQIESCLARVPVDPALKTVITQLAAKGVEFRVLSDANTMFIDVILRANGLDKAVSTIVTNPSGVEDGCLRVRPYHTTPHPDGSTSPSNLCKGRVMREWLSQKAWSRVIYGGDGGNDFAGAINVPAGGVICARNGWSLHKKLQARIAEEGEGSVAPVEVWESQSELAALLASHAGGGGAA